MTVRFLTRLVTPPSASLSQTLPQSPTSVSFAVRSGTETRGLSISRFRGVRAWVTKRLTKLSDEK